MRAVWETTGGRVVGFAPSAAAASVLSDDLGVRADTLHSLIVARRNGAPVDVQAGDLLLVDEAGMAGTPILDEVRALAAERGAVVRLLGDYRQLTAVEAGGALRLIHNDVGGVELNEMRRFTRPDEAHAVLRFRVGDQAAVDWYAENDRVIGGVGPAVLDQLYRDWKADVGAGRVAIMVSDSNEVARELSARAQTERRVAGLAEDHGVRLHDGTVAGVGDRVVTRLNRRNLTLFGGTDFVKNGDLWEVTERYEDGRLTLRHLKHGGEVRLSAAYVARFVELGDAATIHRSQGMSVDVCRAFLSQMAAREAALVALSRGRDANYAYLDTEQVLDVDENPILPGDLFHRYRETNAAERALRAILEREGAELSATEQLRNALDEPHRLSTLVPQYSYARQLHRGPTGMQEAETWVRSALPRYADDVLADEAWPELARVLHDVRDVGVEPVGLLRRRAAQRPLKNDPTNPAESVAQVLHWRITNDMPMFGTGPQPDRPDLLPGWVPTSPHPDDDIGIPGNLAEIVELGTWLRGRAEQIAARVRELGERLAHQITAVEQQNRGREAEPAVVSPPAWTVHLGPVPDDPVVREQWIRRAGQVAAWRERWQIPDTNPDLLPQSTGERERARAWTEAYLRDHPLHRAAADTAERAAHQRGRWTQHVDRVADRAQRQQHAAQERERRRAALAELLHQTWRHEPDLVHIILTATAFDTLARRLSDAADAGYDLREVLAEVPLDILRAPHVNDPAAYTAAMIDVAVERIHTRHAQRDAEHQAQHHAERQRVEQMRDQAGDLVREAWASRPQLAETVITGPAFTALVRSLDRYRDAGLDARTLLEAIPLTKLDAPQVEHKDRFAVYLTHRVAERHLDAITQTRRAAHDTAEHTVRQRAAATMLRQAWSNHPTHADHVIAGPAFRFLAERMVTAEQAGHDVHTILAGLDPIALTAPHVPSPSGTTTYAFSRALEQAHPITTTPTTAPTGPPTPTSSPTTTPSINTTPPAPNVTPATPATTDEPRLETGGPPHEGVAAHWALRPFGNLNDAALNDHIAAAQRDLDRLSRDCSTADQEAEQLRVTAVAGQGQHVRELDDALAQSRAQAALVRDADQLEQQWARPHRTRGRRGRATRPRRTRPRPARPSRARPPHRTHRPDRTPPRHRTHRQPRRRQPRSPSCPPPRQTGPRKQRDQTSARVLRAETDLPHARDAAQARDLADAGTAAQRANDLTAERDHRVHEMDQLRAEYNVRDRLPADARQREDHERDLEHTAPTAADRQPTNPEPPAPTLTSPVLTSPELDNPQLTGLEPGASEPVEPGTLHSPDVTEHGIEHTAPSPDAGDLER